MYSFIAPYQHGRQAKAAMMKTTGLGTEFATLYVFQLRRPSARHFSRVLFGVNLDFGRTLARVL